MNSAGGHYLLSCFEKSIYIHLWHLSNVCCITYMHIGIKSRYSVIWTLVPCYAAQHFQNHSCRRARISKRLSARMCAPAFISSSFLHDLTPCYMACEKELKIKADFWTEEYASAAPPTPEAVSLCIFLQTSERVMRAITQYQSCKILVQQLPRRMFQKQTCLNGTDRRFVLNILYCVHHGNCFRNACWKK